MRVQLSIALGLMLAWLTWAPSFAATEEIEEPAPPQTIGVFGDSLADGMWVGLNYHLRREPRINTIEQLSEVSTGLSNWVYLDVSEKTAEQLAETQYDIAVIMFGANDMQGIRDNEGGIHSFRSESWQAIYRERINILIDQLKDHGAVIYWVGLPVMRSGRYDRNVQFLNEVFAEEAEAAGITYISTREQSALPDIGYSAFLPDRSGVDRLARIDDGVHFTLFGYRHLAEPVVDAIHYGLDNPDFQKPAIEDDQAISFNIFELTNEDGTWMCYLQPDEEVMASSTLDLPLQVDQDAEVEP